MVLAAGAVEYSDYSRAQGVRNPNNGCPGYDTKQSDGEVLVILELWGMRRTPLLPSLLEFKKKNLFFI